MDNDYQPSPYSTHEQQAIMRDLHQSLKTARDEQDLSRAFYTTEAIKDFDHE